MKVGILTFHSQLNYGGVLQCWALKTALEGMGHEVVVVDRWLTPDNEMLEGPFGRASLREWLEIGLKAIMGCGHGGLVLRYWRTRKFVKGLSLTPYHFYEWKEAPKDLGIDCLIVGSDQVWHGGDWGDPRVYLLEEAGCRIRKAIAYAASFGLEELPGEYDYANGFKRFTAISVRETSGIGLVKGAGFVGDVVHVVDPTLLIDKESWRMMSDDCRLARRHARSKVLVCYFLTQDVNEALPILEEWARQNAYEVKVVVDLYFKPVPRSLGDLAGRVSDMVKRSCVKICTGLGPGEFVREFSLADAVVTDSFHAVMFASIFGTNCRFLKAASAMRRRMFGRICDFADRCVKGAFFAEDLAAALCSIRTDVPIQYDAKYIEKRRQESKAWLKSAVGA